MKGRKHIQVAVGVAALFAVGWVGVSRFGHPRHELGARPLGPSLTEHFAFLVATAKRPVASSAAIPALPDPESEDATMSPRSPLDLPRFGETTSMRIRGAGRREGTAVLTNLNPKINDGYVLALSWSDGEESRLHLENARPDLHRLALDPAFPSGIVVEGPGEPRRCDLWSDRVPEKMRDLTARARPYTSLCDGDVLVMPRTRGSSTARE